MRTIGVGKLAGLEFKEVGVAVKAKFRVLSVSEIGAVSMMPVAPQPSEDEESENHRFWNATPSGKIELNITNPQATSFFIEGDEVYVTFEKA